MEPATPEATREPQIIPLYSNKQVEVFIPKKPKIPISEGLQIQTESPDPKNRDNPKNILLRNLYSITAAKIIAEGGQTPQEAWANTRIDEDNQVNAFGRNALNPDSWRKPVDAHDRNAPEIDALPEPYDQIKLQRLFRSYMHRWEKPAEEMSLFDTEVKDEAIDTAGENPQGDQIVWQNESYVAKIIKNPHVRGTHIVVDAKLPPGQEFPRQWMTRLKKGEPLDEKYVKMTLESTAIALGVRELLAEGRGEIHNSGNWAGGLKNTDEGGSLSTDSLQVNAVKEKRSHRPDVSETNDFGTFMHAHVYIPESGRVVLPVMSKTEAKEKLGKEGDAEEGVARKTLEQWTSLPQTSGEQIDRTRKILGNNHLSNWVNSNVRGKLAA